jgi:hypothetical protein
MSRGLENKQAYASAPNHCYRLQNHAQAHQVPTSTLFSIVSSFLTLTGTAISFLVQIDVNRIREISGILLTLFLSERIPRNHLKRLLHVDTLLGTGLEIRHLATALAVHLCALLANHPFVLTQINFIAEHHKRKSLGITRRGLNEELVAPGVESLEGFGAVDVVDQNAAVSAAVEGYAERLEALLSGRVPEL